MLVFKILHFPKKIVNNSQSDWSKADAPLRDRHFKLSIGIEKSSLRQSIKLFSFKTQFKIYSKALFGISKLSVTCGATKE